MNLHTSTTESPGDDNTRSTSTSATVGEGDTEIAKWKSLARKHERRWRSASAELDRLQASLARFKHAGGPKALAALIGSAHRAGADAAYTDCATRLANAELRAAGVPAAIAADVDHTRLVTTDPDGRTVPDMARIAAVAAKVAGAA